MLSYRFHLYSSKTASPVAEAGSPLRKLGAVHLMRLSKNSDLNKLI